MGKTTVAKAVLEQQAVKSRFNIVQVDGISAQPNIKTLLQRVWHGIYDNTEGYPDWLTIDFEPKNARRELAKHLKPNTLLLLDDVWTGEAFRQLCCRSSKDKGSRVLVTSRNHQLFADAGLSKEDCSVHEVAALELDFARSLLCQVAFPGITVPADDTWKKLIDEVVPRCERLPLALTVCPHTHHEEASSSQSVTLLYS